MKYVRYMLNPSKWNWKAKAGEEEAGLYFLFGMWTFFRLPEPKGRAYAELDVLFEWGVPARQFEGARVERSRRGSVVPEKMEAATSLVEHMEN
jgi:SP family general alpha glucoside:H+ symporter-like MFS transporter